MLHVCTYVHDIDNDIVYICTDGWSDRSGVEGEVVRLVYYYRHLISPPGRGRGGGVSFLRVYHRSNRSFDGMGSVGSLW